MGTNTDSHPSPHVTPRHPDSGQATTEYALILLVAAVIALLAIGWATAGGGAGKIGSLFDTLLSGIIDRATSGM